MIAALQKADLRVPGLPNDGFGTIGKFMRRVGCRFGELRSGQVRQQR